MTFDDAVSQLFRAPHADFVAERKRLAAELKGSDKEGAGKLLKLGRPPISAWAVNQLWWSAPDLFEQMFSTARRVREGELAEVPAHKAAVAKLCARASELLTAAGNAAADATLRRVETTLLAIAVNGSFDPDPPGALTEDREAPGFASLGIPSGPSPASSAQPDRRPAAKAKARVQEGDAAPNASAAQKANEREADEARKDAAQKRAAEQAEAEALAAKEEAVRNATAEVARLRANAERLDVELTGARSLLAAAERRLAELE